MSAKFNYALGILGGLLITTSAYAHVSFENSKASIGGSYKAVLRVPHGCKGSPTIKIRVQIPEGVISVKPQPKAGWAIDIVKGKYEKSYTYHGKGVTEGVREIIWSGGNLPDEFYDEFIFRSVLSADLKSGTALYFPVIQECQQGVESWTEIPTAGKSPDDYKSPAPGLELLPLNPHHH